MALILAEQKIPALCIAHLIARRNDADYPTPAADDLTLVAGPVKETTKRTFPSLEVWVQSFTLGTRRDDERLDVILDLYVDASTTLTEELAMLASIRRAFAGGPSSGQANASNSSTNPFLAYCNGLDDSASAGWLIHDFYLSAGSITVLEEKRILYRTEAKCMFQSYQLTV